MQNILQETETSSSYELAINLLADMVLHFIETQSQSKRNAAIDLASPEWTWLQYELDKEDVVWLEQTLTSQLLGTDHYEQIA